MSPERHLKNLKILVVSMGILLVVGFLVTLAGAWVKFKAQKTAGSPCAELVLDMRGKGTLTASRLENGTLTLTFTRKEGGIELVQLDACSGKIQGKLTVQADK